MARVEIAAAAALLAFPTRPTVQTARPAKIKYKDGETQKERDGFVTDNVSCTEEHVLGAAQYGDHVVMVTIDGRRHEGKLPKRAAGTEKQAGGDKAAK